MSTQMYTRTYDPASDQRYSDLHEQKSTVDVEKSYDFCQEEHYVEFNDLECSVGVNYSKSEGKNPERSQSKQPTLDIKRGQEQQKGENSVKTRRHLKNGRNVNQSHNLDSGKWKKVTVISVMVIASAVIFFASVLEIMSETQSTAETPCSGSPCLHDGTCVIQNSTYICQCPTGYKGNRCDVTPCSSNPCFNNGASSVSGSSYRCFCRSSYYGTRCETKVCESGWSQLDDECYYYSDVKRSWDSAQTYCRTLGGILAEPNTRKKIDYLRTESGTYTYWLGGTDKQTESIWRWDSSGSIIYYTDWHTRTIVEPNDEDGEEDCLSISEPLDYE